MSRLPCAAIAAALAALLVPTAASAARLDYGRTVFNVLPPGQFGGLPFTPDSTNQIRLYDDLTPLGGNVSAADIPKYFKSAPFGTPRMAGRRESTPRAGLKIIRDSYDVPHIFGRTRADVEFGAGWVTAEDRSLFIEIIRGPARIAVLDVPGLNAFSLGLSGRTFESSAQTEAFIRSQGHLLARQGPKGRQGLRDVDNYVAGINAYYRKTNNPAKPWTRNDVLAAAALIGAVFGKGGGNELASAKLLSDLRAKLGPTDGREVWNDLRSAQDSEAPTTIAKRFAYDPIPRGSTPGALQIDRDSVSRSALRAGAVDQMSRKLSSNWLLVSRGRSATGRPLAVQGPQISYYYPGFFMELDLHGGGIDARGGAFPGVSLYALIGRGKDYAWSATSASSDIIDEFAEQLCNPDGSPPTRASDHYLYKGRCRAMTTFNAGVFKGSSGGPDLPVTFKQTVHGPVIGTVTSAGRPYAIASDRSTRGRDSLPALAFADLNTNRVHSARDFAKVMNQLEYTFNWSYIDDRDIAYFSSGRLPVRARGTLPGLLTLGTGAYDWKGFLPRSRHPQAINPSRLLSWNNKPAPGFSAADNNFSYQSIQRVLLFKGFRRKNRLQDVVSVMNRAATQDLRTQEVWPVLRRVLAGGPAPDALTQQAADLVTAWRAHRSSRLDRDLDGKIDDPGAAVMDRAWKRMADAVLSPLLGETGLGDLRALLAVDDAPGKDGSAYGGGWYGYVQKDLRSLLGLRVRSRYSHRYCGGGDLAACRASLWAAIKAAADELAAEQGPNPAAWRSDATRERIPFQPGLLTETMRWTNRPTYQQLIEFGGHRPR